MKRALLSLCLLLHCSAGAHLPPGNAPGFAGGPQRAGGELLTRQQVLAGPARSMADALTALPLSSSQPLLFARYTVPLFVTDEPRGPRDIEYSAFCLLWVCVGGQHDEAPRPLDAVHSADVEVQSYFLGSVSVRTVHVNGWPAETKHSSR